MLDYAFYRLPYADEYHVVRGKAEYFDELPDLGGLQGFVMSPFTASHACPHVIIKPEKTLTKPMPKRARRFKLKWREKSNRALYRHDFQSMLMMLDGEVLDKVVLSRRCDCKVAAWSGTLGQIFQKACRLYPRQMVALTYTAKSGAWLMATPEVLLSKDGGKWKTMALAGTMTTQGPWSEKNIREQGLVEQYISEAIEPFAEDVEKSQPHAATAAKLFHLCTDFTFSLKPDASPTALIKALHPTPAVCGLPKEKALAAILQNESIDRRYYSGFCGPWNLWDESRLYVSLRCVEMRDEKNFHLYAGGGLLKESIEPEEWKETKIKLETMKNVLG